MRKFLLRILSILVVVFLTAPVVEARRYRSSPISWSTEQVSETMFPSDSYGLTLSFSSEIDLTDVDLRISGTLRRYVTVYPNHFDTITKDSENSVQITIDIPPKARTGKYRGKLYIKRGFKKYRRPLKLVINVKETLGLNIPHLVYGKVFNSDGSIPLDEDIVFYAYILQRANNPDEENGDEDSDDENGAEVLTESRPGCGYGSFLKYLFTKRGLKYLFTKLGNRVLTESTLGCQYGGNWLWVEAGNFRIPWEIGETLRVIVINKYDREVGIVDATLDASGCQLMADLMLSPIGH